MIDMKIKMDFKIWFVILSKVIKSKIIINVSMVNGFFGNGLIV